MEQRPVDDVAVADHPAHVGRGPEHRPAGLAHRRGAASTIASATSVAAGRRAATPFGPPSRARGIEVAGTEASLGTQS